jgi:hypothetical protein
MFLFTFVLFFLQRRKIIMYQIIKFEFRRAFYNPIFLGLLFIFSAFVIYRFMNFSVPQQDELYNTTKTLTPIWLWLQEVSELSSFRIYFILATIIAALPFGLSYGADVRSNYIQFLYARTKKQHYLLAKYVATFVAGGSIYVFSIIFYYILLICTYPTYPIYFGDIGFMEKGLLGDLLIYSPHGYAIIYCILNFLYAGTYAVLALVTSLFNKNKFAIIGIPFVVHYIFGATLESLGYPWLSPERFLRPLGIEGASLLWTGSLLLILIIGSFVIFLKRGMHSEQ